MSQRPLIFGEVLLDCFPDGSQILGGAPFNVAWNLQGLGLAPLFLSAVGDDENGRDVRRRAELWGMDVSQIQTSARFPTGTTQIEVNEGQPTFNILDNQAYDDIQLPTPQFAEDEISLIYYGSLANRHRRARETIKELFRQSKVPRFVDINVREPWFSTEWFDELMMGASWVKLNDEELSMLSNLPCADQSSTVRAAQLIQERIGGQVLVTRGAKGALAVSEDGVTTIVDGVPPKRVVDTVGAGDAFSAASIFAINRGWATQELLEFAVGFASKACELQGATTEDLSHYLRD